MHRTLGKHEAQERAAILDALGMPEFPRDSQKGQGGSISLFETGPWLAASRDAVADHRLLRFELAHTVTVAIGALLLIPVSIATLPAHAQFKSNDRPITATQKLIPRATVRPESSLRHPSVGMRRA
jgi:hypothetical protein